MKILVGLGLAACGAWLCGLLAMMVAVMAGDLEIDDYGWGLIKE